MAAAMIRIQVMITNSSFVCEKLRFRHQVIKDKSKPRSQINGSFQRIILHELDKYQSQRTLDPNKYWRIRESINCGEGFSAIR